MWTAVSIASFLAGLALGSRLVASALGSGMAAALEGACLGGTFLLSGFPQSVEAACIAGTGRIDTHVLMSLAAWGTLAMGMASEGALLLLLFQLSHTLEERFTARATGSVGALLDSIPTQATLVTLDASSGGPLMQSAQPALARQVSPGQLVLVKPGEQVPLDGVVAWGTAAVSMAHISGESVPVRVRPGTEVAAGSFSADGLLVVRVSRLADDSTPARIARMTQQAQASRPRLTRMLDRVASVWSTVVVLVAAATTLLLPLLGVPFFAPAGAPAMGGSLYRAMGVLTAGAPCALVLVPLAYVCAIAAVSRRGVLLKSAAALDALAQITAIALDKTGTLTTGALTLADARVLLGHSDDHTDGHSDGRSDGHSDGGSDCDGVEAADEEGSSSARRRGEQEGGEGRVRVLWPPRARDATASAAANSATSAADSLTSPADSAIAALFAPARGSDALRRCLALCRGSTHPVARAVVEAAGGGRPTPPQSTPQKSTPAESTPSAGGDAAALVSKFEQVPGRGVQGLVRLSATEPEALVRFGSASFVLEGLAERSAARLRLEREQAEYEAASAAGHGSKARSYLSVAPVAAVGTAPEASSSSGSADAPAKAHSGTQTTTLCVLSFEDAVAPGAAAAVTQLRAGGGGVPPLSVVMLTGDNKGVASQVATQLGITDYRSGMRPEDKLSYVRGFGSPSQKGASIDKAAGGRLLMMGDGINDAPALAAAHVGIAVASTPTDMVAAAADVIVLNGQGVANLPGLILFAHRTQSIITQNLVLALASVAVATLPTAAGIFPLWLAVLLHEGATLLVALNSLRLLLDPPSIGGTSNASPAGALSVIREMFAEGARDRAARAGHDHSHDHGHIHDHSLDHSHNHSHAKNGTERHAHDHDHSHDHSHAKNSTNGQVHGPGCTH
ncbi:hypothetical protein FOA52_013483 [Chlamydomonas sp. UWO 241]|nr:hypothetical protein FOA52_013483 [Chlamydomonas sp. UWO 241]